MITLEFKCDNCTKPYFSVLKNEEKWFKAMSEKEKRDFLHSFKSTHERSCKAKMKWLSSQAV